MMKEIRVLQEQKNLCATLFVAFLTAVWGCGPDRQTVIQEKVAEQVSAFRSKKMAECRTELLQKAEKTADSLLIQHEVDALNDSLARSRPGRPFRPAPIPPLDSTPIKPIFDQ